MSNPENLLPLTRMGHVSKIFEDTQKNLWFGLSNKGLVKYDGQTLHHFTVHHGLASDAMRNITQDSEGNIWIGTDGDGLMKYTESPWLFYGKEQGIDDGFVWSILEHSDGSYWMGSTAGLLHFDGQKFEYLFKELGKKLGILMRIVELKNGNLLIGTLRKGLYEYDGKNLNPVSEKYGLEPRSIQAILQDGDALYFFQNQHLIRHEHEKTTSFTSDLPEIQGFASDLFLAKNGDIWIALNKGILKFNGKTFESYTEKTGLKNVPIMQIAEDAFGRIWFGTYGQGLIYYDGKTFTPVGKPQGLASNAIYSVALDKTGNIWAGTQLGATQIRFKKNGQIEKIQNHGKHEGFFGVENNGKAIFCDSQNNVWFGTIEGVQKYKSNLQIQDTIPPRVRLKEIQLFMQKTSWQNDDLKEFCHTENGFQLPQNLVLPYDRNHLTFRFESSSRRVPEKVRYQWKLAGAEHDWTPVTDKDEAVYANLRPGFYVFQLRSMNDQGLWSQELKYEFRIMPPIWQRWWFLTFSFVGMVGLIITGARLRMRHRIKMMRQKNEELEQMVQIRTKEVTRQNHEILEKNTELEQQQEEILAQNDHINRQNYELQRKNEDITASINYARRIQRAILPFEERMQIIFPEHFIFFKPRDIVSGDFYWFQQVDNQKFIISALDCTGHGVPGAFMSMIGDAILSQAVLDKQIHQADEILNYLNQGVRKALQQDNSGNQDGMDAALCVVDLKHRKMQFAGAMNPIFYVQNQELHIIKGDKMPIGGVFHSLDAKFTRHEIDLKTPTTFYIFSDGYQDQFGGTHKRKFMVKRFRQLLFEIHAYPMSQQHQLLETTLQNWMQHENQIDDILVIGGKV